MATPASRFRAHGPVRGDQATGSADQLEVVEPPVTPAETAVEFERRVPPSGDITLLPGKQVSVPQGLAGRTLTVWADLRTIHLSLDGELVRTLSSRLLPDDLAYLTMRGARPAGPAPAAPALRRLNGNLLVEPGQAVEVERKVRRHGNTSISGHNVPVGFRYAHRPVTLRLDGHLMHAIVDSALVGTWPCPIPTNQLKLPGARTASSPLPLHTASCLRRRCPGTIPEGRLGELQKLRSDSMVLTSPSTLRRPPRLGASLPAVAPT